MTRRPYLVADAGFSDDGIYRYWLERRIGMGERTICFVGLNPSTATQTVDDPTVRRCVGFARRWGFDWHVMGNLHAYRSTDPKALRTVDDPVGPENQEWLKVLSHRAEIVVCAWGGMRLACYPQTLAGWLMSLPHARHLGLNDNGSPKHPLYLPSTTPLQEFSHD